MAIAWDTSVESVRTDTSDPATWTHTPVGTPRAIVVAIVHGTSSTDHVSTVTYGGVSMGEVIRRTDTSTEPGAAELWFLGTGIPTGPQTVSVDLASATTDDIHFVSMSFTADLDTMVVDSDGISENATNPSVTLQYNSRTCLSVAALYGGGASPASFSPNGNCTAVQDHDLGAFYSTVIRQTTPGTSDFAIGGTASGDDVAYVAAAISEIYGVYATPGSYAVTGTDATLTWVGQIHLKASSDIAASAATATTARLTAPSGKTTSDFVAGKISDDTNPLPTIDITADDYTELEWCIETVAGLTASDVYEFRVLAGTTALDTYTVTPQWTIGATAYSMGADSGSYVVTGTATGIARQITIVPDSGSYAITGTDTGIARQITIGATSGAYDITGTDVTLTYTAANAYTLVPDSGVYDVTGTATGLLAALRIAPDSGAYDVTGTTTGLLGGFRLAADAGDYAVTGTDVTLTYSPSVYIVASSYIATNGEATTARLTAPAGKTTAQFVYGWAADDRNETPGQVIGNNEYTEFEWCLATSAGLTTDDVYEFRVVQSAPEVLLDTYSVTPTWTIGALAYTLTADSGSYTISGTAAGLYFGATVIATPGSYAITGTDANLVYAYAVAADPGSYVLTGTAVALTPQTPPGTYTLTGTAVSLGWNRHIDTDIGSYDVVGVDTSLTAQRELVPDAGAYAVTGTDAQLVFEPAGAFVLAADSGTYTITGTDAALLSPRSVIVEPGVYLVTGTAAGVTATRYVLAASGDYAVTGSTVTLQYGSPVNRTLLCAAGAYAVTGRPVDMRYGNTCPPPRGESNRHPRPKPFVAGSK